MGSSPWLILRRLFLAESAPLSAFAQFVGVPFLPVITLRLHYCLPTFHLGLRR